MMSPRAFVSATDDAGVREPLGFDELVVAVQDGASAEATIRAASLVAARFGARPSLLTVVEPVPSPNVALGVEGEIPERTELEDAERVNRLQDRVQLAIREDHGSWTISVVHGDLSRSIQHFVTSRGAGFLVLGRGQHGMVARLFGEKSLGAMVGAEVPALAVERPFVTLPHRIVVAVDFGASSTRAGRLAAAIAGRPAVIHLLHVAPTVEEETVTPELTTRFEALHAALGVPDEIPVRYAVRGGAPAGAILRYAETVGAELLATGTRGLHPTRIRRTGSVATALVRGAQCSVLIVPDGA